jgi:hypothetical protein
MFHIPPIIFDIIRWLTMFILVSGCVTGGIMGTLFLMRRRDNYWVNLLYGLLLLSISFTVFDKFLRYSLLSYRYPNWSFLPIYMSFAFAPLLFFYVKSRLYAQHFTMHRRDFKHFILPTVQFVLLSWVTLQDVETKMDFRDNFFSPFYGNFEKGVFILQFFLYLYFSYRFILHEKLPLSIKARKGLLNLSDTGFRRQILIVGWLKRMVKTLFILFGVHASFILTDYFSFRLFGLNLQTKPLFSALYELSFVAMLAWLFVNGIFAWRKKV